MQTSCSPMSMLNRLNERTVSSNANFCFIVFSYCPTNFRFCLSFASIVHVLCLVCSYLPSHHSIYQFSIYSSQGSKAVVWQLYHFFIPFTSLKPSEISIMAGRPIGRKLLNKAWYGTYTQNTAQGLQNGGNDCYRLALLQCLIHIPTFCRFIQTAHRPKVRHSAQQCVYCSFHALINEYWITRNPAAFSNFLGSRAVVDLYAAMNASIVIGTANPTPLDVSAVITSVDQEDCMDFWLAVTNMLSPGGQTWYVSKRSFSRRCT